MLQTISLKLIQSIRMLTMKSNTAGVVKVHIEGDLGYADLYTADTVCVFLSESDVINISPSMQGRLAALSKVSATGSL